MAAQRLVTVGGPTLPIPSFTSFRPFSSFRSHRCHQSGAFWKRKTPAKILISLSSTSSGSKLAALPFDLSPPPIDHDLLETVTLAGAKVSDDGIIETFNNDDEALDAADNGVVGMVTFLYDPHAMVFCETGQVLFKFSSLDHIDFSLSHQLNTRPQLGSSNGSEAYLGKGEVKSLTGGVFLAVSSNTRYQIINGLECLVERSAIAKQVPSIALAFTVGVRFANNVYGGMQFVDWARWSGVQ